MGTFDQQRGFEGKKVKLEVRKSMYKFVKYVL